MAIELDLSHSEQVRLALSKRQQKTIASMYSNLQKTIKERQSSLSKESMSDSIRSRQLKELQQDLNRGIKSLGLSLEGNIKDSMKEVSEAVVKDNLEYLDSIGLDVKVALAHVPNDTVLRVASGKLYKSNWTLSKAIWTDIGRKQADIDLVIAKGIALNKSAYDIAKDLESYVDPKARKDWSWSKVYPNASRVVDYSSQRLARTMVSHAYQQALVTSTKDNPFVTGFEWHSAGIHGRTCETCSERDGQVYSKTDLPLDHPNGLCTYIAVIKDDPDAIIDKIANWHNSPDGTYPELDKFAASLNSDKPNKISNPQPSDARKEVSAPTKSEVIKEIRNLPNYEDTEWKKTPYAYAGRDAQIELATNLSYNRAENDLGNVEVKLSKLKTVQPMVMEDNLVKMIENGVNLGHTATQEIVVVLLDDDYVIVDGNHRATLAKLSGKESITVHLKKLK